MNCVFLKIFKFFIISSFLFANGLSAQEEIALEGSGGGKIKAILRNLFIIDRDRISVKGNNYLKSEQIFELLNSQESFYVWELAGEDSKKQLLRDPWLKDVKFKWKLFPLGVDLVIKEQVPYAVVEFYNESWLVAQTGEMIESLTNVMNPQVIVSASHLPRMSGIDELKNRFTTYASAGNRLKYALTFLKALREVKQLPFSIESITLLEDGSFSVIPVELSQYPKIIFPYSVHENMLIAIKKIDAIVQDARNNNKKLTKIDLRFNYAIATF
jgi:hypothetical protein